MKQTISNWLKAPEFPNDDEKTRRGRLAYILALNMLVVLLLFGVGSVIFIFASKLISGLLVAGFILLALLSLVLLRQGYVTLTSAIFLFSIWLACVAMVSVSDGMRSLDIIFFITGTVLAGLLLDIRGAAIFGGASITVGLVMVILSSSGVQLPKLFPFPPLSGWAILVINIAFTLLPLSMTLQSLNNVARRARQELAERQRADEKLLRLSAISRSISTLQDLDNVLESIYAELTKAMSLDLFLLSLYDPSTNEVSYPFVIDEGVRSKEPSHQRNPGTLFDRVITGSETILVNRTAEQLAKRNAIMSAGKASYIGAPRASASMMYVPMIVQSQVIGLISVHSYTLNAYDESTLEFLKNVALQAAIAIQNARLFEAQQQELAERKTAEHKLLRLNAISRSISTLQDMENVFEAIYTELSAAIPLDSFFICVYNPQANELAYPFVIEDRQRAYEPTGPKSPGTLFDRVITGGEIILVNRTAEEVTQRNMAMAAGRAGYIGSSRASASMMYVPLVAQAQILGVLSVQSYTLSAYDENSLEFLKNVALQAAIAIQNARLFEAQQQELAERKTAEHKLQESLQEKEVLLKEIHHRVKNNMQVIVSMMSLQSAYITEPQLLDIFTDSQNRVRSMALVHEQLYKSRNLAQIDFRNYLQHLASTLFHSYSPRTSNLDLTFDIGDIALGVDAAIPCGLIVNELISNALKHAFPNNRMGKVQIGLQSTETGLVHLSIADDGVGLPEGKNWRHTESLGMQLVQSLVKQIDGTIEMTRLDPGTHWKVQFKIPEN